jgi:hypothetical protein
MKVTAIIKNVSSEFFEGFGESITGLNNLIDDKERFNYLMNMGVKNPSIVSTKVGRGTFGERVELNRMRQQDYKLSYKLENRRGYKLATFEVSA